jgi:hypothetical protein
MKRQPKRKLTQTQIVALVDAIELECGTTRAQAWIELRRRDPEAFDRYGLLTIHDQRSEADVPSKLTAA